MGITAAYMVPHPPLIVPAVGRGGEKEIADIEGVSQPAVHYSLQSAIRQMRYVLDI